MYKYKLYPSTKQQTKLLNQFNICKEIYNTLLSESKEYYFTSRYDFNCLVGDIKLTCPNRFNQVHSQVLQNVSDRVHKSLDNFFNRIKLKKQGVKVKAGFPRFKSKIHSITYPQSGFKFLSNKRLKLSKIGNVPIVLHRIPKGKIKTLTIKLNNANQWFAVFSCEIDIPEVVNHQSTKKIGIDVGLTKFLTDNKGRDIVNPRFYVHAEKKLARLQRVHSRKVKGSKNREKSRIKLARQHIKVFNQRTDFLHKLTSSLAKEFKIIYGERLNIKSMVKSNLAKHILDVSWGRFYNMLSYKVVINGGELKKNPKTRGSSKRCSNCGVETKMTLSQRTFHCPICGFVCHRDKNSAINHIQDTEGHSEISTPVETPSLSSTFGKVNGVVESGTINDC